MVKSDLKQLHGSKVMAILKFDDVIGTVTCPQGKN